MTEAAQGLLEAALSAWRVLTRPTSGDIRIVMDPVLPDPERWRADLAELAVNVVTAADYLLILLSSASAAPPRRFLSRATAAQQARTDPEAYGRQTRRRLDARGEAVCLGIRLRSALRSHVASL